MSPMSKSQSPEQPMMIYWIWLLMNRGSLVTEDKDFSELVYSFKKPAHGVILIRIGVKYKYKVASVDLIPQL